MKAAILNAENKVVNIAKIDNELFAQEQGWIVSSTAKIGDTYDAVNDIFISPPPPPEPVPATVSKRQAKQQLLIAGLLDNVQPAIDAIPDATERELTQIYWDDSQEFERNHPTLTAIASQALGLTDEQLDQLFIAASKL